MILLPSRLGIFSNEPIINKATRDNKFTVRCLEAFAGLRANADDDIVYVGFPLARVGDICLNIKDDSFWLFVQRKRDIGDPLDEGIFESPKWMKLGLIEERVPSELDKEYFTIRIFTRTAQLYQSWGKDKLLNEVFVRARE